MACVDRWTSIVLTDWELRESGVECRLYIDLLKIGI